MLEERYAFENRLRKNFPEMIPPRYFEVACGPGWYPLIYALCKCIQEHINSIPPTEYAFQVVQIKEKFGGLRFYAHNPDDFIVGIIDSACSFSSHICEECGDTGSLDTSQYWIRTLCEHHKENRK